MSLSTTDVPLAEGEGKETLPAPVTLDEGRAADANIEDAFEDNIMLSNDTTNPSEFVTWESRGTSYQFASNPMRKCVWIILVLRAVQMGLNYGLLFINPGFLTGMYYVCAKHSFTV